MRARLFACLGVIVVACGPPPEPREPRLAADDPMRPTEEQVRRMEQRFTTVETAFLDWYYESYPVRATALGLHSWDAHLPAQDRASIQRRIDDLLDWLTQLGEVRMTLLEDDRRFDFAVLEYAIRAELLDLEEIRPWANDPRHYVGLIADGLATVAGRPYAPVGERIPALVSRMREAVPLLAAARANLRTPPRLWTELAIADTRGLVSWLRDDLPAALAAQGAAPDAVTGAAEALAGALEAYAAWLSDELLPRSNGDFRLGQYLFQRKLLYEEHVNLGAQRLDQINEQKIAEYTARVTEAAARIDPSRSPREIMDSLTRVHPAPADLLPTARDMMMRARDWVLESGVVAVPTAEMPQVVETPPYARGGFAAMDAPGPFDDPGLDAFFYITNVDTTWTAEQQAQHLTYFSYPGLFGVTLHETFPGHFVQLAHVRALESRVRKTFLPASLVEGWAHYAEEMALDEGFGDDDPALRLGQLRRALQRHARWYAALHLHAFGADLETVVRRFMDIAYFDEFPARREVMRATYDATYLHYALGRMQIMELREAWREKAEERDGEFSLREFHDRLLALGLPLSLASEAMLNPPRGPRLEPLGPRRMP